MRVHEIRCFLAPAAKSTPPQRQYPIPKQQRKTRGRVDRYSFLVRLFHPLLHAGFSRRTNIAITLKSAPHTNRPQFEMPVDLPLRLIAA
jgi:hypothetical protein